MKYKRSAGILLHPTSLPGRYGIGDLGKEVYKFIDFLASSGQSLWQVFPLGPTGYGDSPYQCFSAFAGNPLLISPDLLIEEGLLSKKEIGKIPKSGPHKIDYGKVINFKYKLLRKAYDNFKKNGNGFNKECGGFCKNNKSWLEDYALFMACKNYHGGKVWSEWDDDISLRKKGAVKKWKEKLKDDIEFNKFVQFTFFKQWKNVKQYANEKGIQIIGDMPIYIAYDSSDLWSNKSLFTVGKNGELNTVAGVPPDYFSATGQLWGNPLYKWDKMKQNGFKWWLKRLSQMYELVDIVRIDHFRGFEAYYSIPGSAETAEHGEWIKAPGNELFDTVKNKLGDVPILAEDLGVITKEVRALRDKYDFPGMIILQFAFGDDGEKHFLPHNLVSNRVVYTGSHDNDTTKSFFEKEKKVKSGIYEHAQRYMNYYGKDMCGALIKTAYKTVADIVIIPLQDILELGNEARMNFPGKPQGNWQWRFTWEQIYKGLDKELYGLVELYERNSHKETTLTED